MTVKWQLSDAQSRSLLITLPARRQDLSRRAIGIGTVDEEHPCVIGCAVVGRVPSRNADHIPGTGFHPLTVALDDQRAIENIVDLIVLVAITELAAPPKFPLTQGQL